MSSEAYVDSTGQRLMALFPPPCADCQWRACRRCSGPQTVESQLRRQGKLLTCFDTAKTARLLENLDRRRQTAVPSYRILQGLPASIPVLVEGMPEVRLDPDLLYGIALDDLLREDGSISFSTGRELRSAFRLPPSGRICLFASVRDTRLEGFWARSETDRIWSRIRRLRFEFVTGTSFSVFEQQSRNGQLFNQDRNMLSVELLARAGVPVVPVCCEVVEEDLEFAARWLTDRPSLRVIAGLAQGWRTDGEFKRFLERMKFLKSRISHPLHFLIIGCSSRERVQRLFRELVSVTVANTNLTLKGVNGVQWDSEQLKLVPMPEDVSPSDLLPQSLEDFAEFCESCARTARGEVQYL